MFMFIKINKDGYVESPYITDVDREVEITEEKFEEIANFPFDYNWRYVNGEFVLEPLPYEDNLRHLRERKCFRLIDNKSQMWYKSLTDEQNKELEEWYNAWLNITDTKVIPTQPSWLK